MIINSPIKSVLIDLMDVPEHYLYKFTSEPQLLRLLKCGPQNETYVCVLIKDIRRFPEISKNNVYLISSPNIVIRPKSMGDMHNFKEQLSELIEDNAVLENAG